MKGLYIVLICLFTISCGSGTITTADKNNVRQGFAPVIADCSSPPPESVYMCRNASGASDGLIAVDIFINSSTPVFGAAFDIVYDPALLEVARKEDGSVDFLKAGDMTWKRLFVVEPKDNNGRLIIGASIGGSSFEGVALARATEPITGNIPLLTLRFRIPSENTTLQFANNRLIDLTGQPITIDQDSWYGGDLSP